MKRNNVMLIGLTGLAGSGKDTFADVLVGMGWRKCRFAAPIKAMAVALTGESPENLETQQGKRENNKSLPEFTNREVLQKLNVIKQAFGRDVFVRLALKDILCDDAVVFSDVRFPEEAKAIRAAGGAVIRMNRAGAGLSGGAANHASEAPLPEELVSFTQDNNGGIGEIVSAGVAADFAFRAVNEIVARSRGLETGRPHDSCGGCPIHHHEAKGRSNGGY